MDLFGPEHVSTCFGVQTKAFRETAELPKDHDIDAVCISCAGSGIIPKADMPEPFEIRQFRRHDRQLVRKQSERTYYLDGVPVCKNRHKRFEQKDDSLAEFRKTHPKQEIGRLKVKRSTRSYNDPDRLMPGAVFEYKGRQYVLTGTKNLGTRLLYEGCKASGVSAKQCRVVRHNSGLVYQLQTT